MNIFIEKNYDELSKKVANFIVEYVNKKPDSLLCLAGGDTPLKTYEYLVEAQLNNIVDFSKCKFVGLDEWVGIGYNTVGSCKRILFDSLFIPLNIKDEQISFFDGLNTDLYSECSKTDKFIADNNGIDLALLGIGMNGHLGFNEPMIDENLKSTIVNLDPITVDVSSKYFNTNLRITKGITLGLKQLKNTNTKIVMANGHKKAKIIKDLVNFEPTNKIPATLLKKENNLLLFIDKEASSLLK